MGGPYNRSQEKLRTVFVFARPHLEVEGPQTAFARHKRQQLPNKERKKHLDYNCSEAPFKKF